MNENVIVGLVPFAERDVDEMILKLRELRGVKWVKKVKSKKAKKVKKSLPTSNAERAAVDVMSDKMKKLLGF